MDPDPIDIREANLSPVKTTGPIMGHKLETSEGTEIAAGIVSGEDGNDYTVLVFRRKDNDGRDVENQIVLGREATCALTLLLQRLIMDDAVEQIRELKPQSA